MLSRNSSKATTGAKSCMPTSCDARPSFHRKYSVPLLLTAMTRTVWSLWGERYGMIVFCPLLSPAGMVSHSMPPCRHGTVEHVIGCPYGSCPTGSPRAVSAAPFGGGLRMLCPALAMCVVATNSAKGVLVPPEVRPARERPRCCSTSDGVGGTACTVASKHSMSGRRSSRATLSTVGAVPSHTAPASSSQWTTTNAPSIAAMWSGVSCSWLRMSSPPLFHASRRIDSRMSPPSPSSSQREQLLSPTTTCRGVSPSRSRRLTSAPASISSRNAHACALPAATCRGVQPLKLHSSRSAPWEIITSATFVWRCRGVHTGMFHISLQSHHTRETISSTINSDCTGGKQCLAGPQAVLVLQWRSHQNHSVSLQTNTYPTGKRCR
eukprot:m.532644 g.532644  ORF g.532644 m.532644 type:complete len:379 (-) comp22048_c0_seq3:1107-2243(-)